MNKVLIVITVFLGAALIYMAFVNFQLSIKLGHSKDNLTLINEDLEALNSLLEESDCKLKNTSLKFGHFDSYSNVIRFQLITIAIDSNGTIKSISH